MQSLPFQLIDSDEKIYWTDKPDQTLRDFIEKGGYNKVVALTDENSWKYCFKHVSGVLGTDNVIILMQGEEHKSLASSHFIWQKLLENKADRNSLIVNIGGGVITDLGGFSASVYKRGIDFINVPTTLMAIVDASVGGKTAINFEGVKNVIGSFKKPEATILFPSFLNTLPERHLKSGFAEMLKHAMLSGGDMFERFFHPEFNFSLINGKDIVNTIRFKLNVVRNDFSDKGIRRQLNLGHTLGHAFESYFATTSSPLTHGESVAAGLLAEAYISAGHQELREIYLDLFEPALKSLFKWPKIPESDFNIVMEFIENDKKNQHGLNTFILLRKPGDWFVSNTVKDAEVIEAIMKLNAIAN